MSKRAELPQERRHIQIFDEDWEFLVEAYGPGSPSKIGAGPAIRKLVHSFCLRQRQQYQEQLDAKMGASVANQEEEV